MYIMYAYYVHLYQIHITSCTKFKTVLKTKRTNQMQSKYICYKSFPSKLVEQHLYSAPHLYFAIQM